MPHEARRVDCFVSLFSTCTAVCSVAAVAPLEGRCIALGPTPASVHFLVIRIVKKGMGSGSDALVIRLRHDKLV